jgi:hypothetical protein
VHALIYPDREPVCDHCRAEQGKAYYAIKRWAEQQDSSPSTSTSSTVKKSTSTARFKSDHTIYTPHGLGIAYTNANLTDKAARYIIANDSDAKALFSELPPEANDEDEQKASPAAPAQAPTAPAATGEIDYVKLAQAIVDIQNKQKAQQPDQQVQALQQEAKESGQPLPSATSTVLTASTGGAADAGSQPSGTDNSGADADGDDKPVRLSRMNKEQLVATYTAELGQAPAEGLTNDELRDAIAEKRSSVQDPE